MNDGAGLERGLDDLQVPYGKPGEWAVVMATLYAGPHKVGMTDFDPAAEENFVVASHGTSWRSVDAVEGSAHRLFERPEPKHGGRFRRKG